MELPIKHARYLLFIAVLAGAGLVSVTAMPLERALPISFDVAAIAFILSSIGMWRDSGNMLLRKLSARDDGGRVFLLVFTGLIIFAVFGTLAILLKDAGKLPPSDIALMGATIVIAWLFGNLIYASHYAHLYYDDVSAPSDAFAHRGGLKFPENPSPCFADFVNFSFVIGMTCQTADIEITSASMRRSSTVHSVLAFFFNLVVLALVVNVMANAL